MILFTASQSTWIYLYMLNKCQYFKDKNLKRIAEDIRKSRADISENE